MGRDYLKFHLNLHLPSLFDPQFRNSPEKEPRRRLFTTKSFFLTMLYMVSESGLSSSGLALIKGFISNHDRSPVSKSAFCQLRRKISYRYFKVAFEKLSDLFSHHEDKWKNLQVVAIDGMQLTVPRSTDLVKNRFTGRKTSQYSESYMPKGFMTIAFNVLNGSICRHAFNPTLNEIADALSMIPKFGANTLFLYDRLYFCQNLLKAHRENKSFFVARLKRNANKAVDSFFSSKRTFRCEKIEGEKVYFVKIKGPKGLSIYATNLPRHLFTIPEIGDLYKMRWQVETCFYDLSTTCSLEKWHSKSLNGILQELYLRMWIFNASRLLMRPCQKFASVGQREYRRANFRAIHAYIRDNIHRYWSDFSKLFYRVKEIVAHTSERRIVNKKQTPRVIKSPQSPYKYCSTEWQWDKKWGLT